MQNTLLRILSISAFTLLASHMIITQELLFGDVILNAAVFTLVAVLVGALFRRWRLFAVVALIILIAARLLFGAETEIEKMYSLGILAVCGFAWGAVASLKEATHERLIRANTLIHVVSVVFLLVISSVLVFSNLHGRTFQNDEYFHVEVAKGLIETGEPVLWDFVHNAPQQDENGKPEYYDRALVYSAQTALVAKLFGFSETVLRLPSALWYLLSVLGVYLVTWFWRKDVVFSLLTSLIFVFYDQLIYHGRIVRMYDMLVFWSSLAMVLWFVSYRVSLQKELNIRKVIMAILGAIGATAIAVLTHRVFLIFGVAFGMYLFAQLIAQLVSKQQLRFRRTAAWVVVGLACALTGLLLSSVYAPYILGEFGLRANPNVQYERTIFADFALPGLAVAAYISALWFGVRCDTEKRFMGLVSLCTIILFVLVVKRYTALRYILFIVPMVIIFVSDHAYTVLRSVTQWSNKCGSFLGVSAVFVLLFVPLSWPGVSANMLLNEARADRDHAHGYGHQFDKAYTFIQGKKNPQDPVFVQSMRSYYWGEDFDTPFFDMGREREVTLADFDEALEEYAQQGEGVWFVWAAGKAHHVRPAIRDFLKKEAQLLHESEPELQGTNMHVYYMQAETILQHLQ